jgi:hypothetical protein
MLVYHRTYHAAGILREGFRDGAYVMPGLGELRGVSTDWPLDENEGADGDTVLALDIPEAVFVESEHVKEDEPYREAMIPADTLNNHRSTLRALQRGRAARPAIGTL